jgi:putative ABC transport system permease protein
MNAVSARELIVGDVRKPLLVLLGAVGFILLIACANVASLMLARASARREELTVRVALGAGRSRLLRQLLAEALAFGLTGGAIGLVLAHAATRALVSAQPGDIPRLEEIGLDRTVLLFTLGIALLATCAFGALPALLATGQVVLRSGGRNGGADRKSQRSRAGLVVAEIALAVVLLTGAGLLLRSLVAMTRVAPGFVAGDAMAFRIALFGRTLALTLIGVSIGVAASFAVGRVIQNQLFGVELLDPPTLSVVVLVLVTSASAAGYLPACRAARLDPVDTLRQG